MDALNHYQPTARERASLKRHWALRRGLVILPFSALLFFGASRLVPEESATLLIGILVMCVLTTLGPLLYVSFLLRCPRCKGWIGLGSSICLGCGLKTAEATSPSGPRDSK
jgi:hypothetical protein